MNEIVMSAYAKAFFKEGFNKLRPLKTAEGMVEKVSVVCILGRGWHG